MCFKSDMLFIRLGYCLFKMNGADSEPRRQLPTTVFFAIKFTFVGYQFLINFYSQNRCLCSRRSHGPLLCAFCLCFHFNVCVDFNRANITIIMRQSYLPKRTCSYYTVRYHCISIEFVVDRQCKNKINNK